MHAEKFEEEEEEDEKTESRVTKKKESESNGANVGNYSQFWSDLQSNLKAFYARERERVQIFEQFCFVFFFFAPLICVCGSVAWFLYMRSDSSASNAVS